VQATYSTETTVSSTSYTDSGLTASITPSSVTSKVMILVSQSTQVFQGSTTSTGGSLNLVRTSTEIVSRADGSIFIEGASATLGYSGIQNIMYLDSPATTSATTYKTQQRARSGGNMRTQPNASTSIILLLEIGA